MQFKKSIWLIGFALNCACHAQINDMQLWMSAGAKKLINNRTNVSINFGTRFAENLSWRNYQFVQMALQRKLLPNLNFALACRLFQSEELEYSRYKVRLMADVSVKKKWLQTTFSFRSRYQLDRSLIYNYESALLPIHKWRNRLEVTFRKSKLLQPDFSAEVWYDFRQKFRSFNNLRLRSGLTYQPDKHHAYSVGFIYDQPINRFNTYSKASIINCSYLLTF